jgi:hypothetical protein
MAFFTIEVAFFLRFLLIAVVFFMAFLAIEVASAREFSRINNIKVYSSWLAVITACDIFILLFTLVKEVLYRWRIAVFFYFLF